MGNRSCPCLTASKVGELQLWTQYYTRVKLSSSCETGFVLFKSNLKRFLFHLLLLLLLTLKCNGNSAFYAKYERFPLHFKNRVGINRSDSDTTLVKAIGFGQEARSTRFPTLDNSLRNNYCRAKTRVQRVVSIGTTGGIMQRFYQNFHVTRADIHSK